LLIAECDLGEASGDQAVAIGGGVLVDHGHRWCGVAEAAHEVGERGP